MGQRWLYLLSVVVAVECPCRASDFVAEPVASTAGRHRDGDAVNDYSWDIWNVVLIRELDEDGMILRDTRNYWWHSDPPGWLPDAMRTGCGCSSLHKQSRVRLTGSGR